MIRRERARLVYLVATHHNPAGTTLPPLRRRAVARMARRLGVVLVEDCTHADLALHGPPPAPIAAFDPEAPVITVGSLSKLLWGGLRLGFVRAPETSSAGLGRLKAASDHGTSVPSQAIAAAALERAEDARALRLTEVGERARPARGSAGRAPPRVDLPPARRRLSLWPRLPHGDADVLAQIALRHGVAIVPGTTCSPDGGPPPRPPAPGARPGDHAGGHRAAGRGLGGARAAAPPRRRARRRVAWAAVRGVPPGVELRRVVPGDRAAVDALVAVAGHVVYPDDPVDMEVLSSSGPCSRGPSTWRPCATGRRWPGAGCAAHHGPRLAGRLRPACTSCLGAEARHRRRDPRRAGPGRRRARQDRDALHRVLETDEPSRDFLTRRGFAVVSRDQESELLVAESDVDAVDPPAGIRISTLAAEPALVHGMYEVALEAMADVPGEEPATPPDFERWRAVELQRVDTPADAQFAAVGEDGQVVGYALLALGLAQPDTGCTR